MWNLEVSVGRGGQNSNRADVEFLQWYYRIASANPLTAPERRDIYKGVVITGVCTGLDDDHWFARSLRISKGFLILQWTVGSTLFPVCVEASSWEGKRFS